MIEKLLKAGADANAAAPEGETALMTAARTGNVEAARVLLAHGASVDARESWRGQTALMWAAAQNHPAMVRELLANGADVNARSAVQNWERQNTQEPREKWLPPGGLTPLLFAARQGSLESARILVEAGADVNVTDPGGISAGAVGHHQRPLRRRRVSCSRRARDPNLADTDGRAALFAAVDMNTMPVSNVPMPKVIDNRLTSLDLIERLLARGANVNAQLTSQQAYRSKLDRGTDTVLTTGSTPLLRAAKAGDVAAVRLLLEKGADAKLATRAGVNPLMIAAGLGTKEEDTTGRSKTEADTIATIDAAARRRPRRHQRHQCRRHHRPDRAARRRAAGIRSGRPVSGRARREAGRQGQARIHAARCRDGTRRRRRIRRESQQSPRKYRGAAA